MRLDRLRQLTGAELRWRAGDAWRTTTERLSSRLRTPTWQRHDLLNALSPHALNRGLRAALSAGQWDEANVLLAQQLASRPARHVLDPADAPAIRARILETWPDATGDAARQADRIVEGRYDLLGYRDVSFRAGDTDVDWHVDAVHGRRAPRVFWSHVPYLDPSVGDHKVIWELNRHQHWLRLGRASWLTGDPAYATRIVQELDSWLAANPPLVGINWASMLEVGFRSLSWVWAVSCLIGDQGSGTRDQGPGVRDQGPGIRGPWLIDLLLGVDRQLTHIERHLSYYFSPNTHLTGEALALYVSGTALPELARSGRWADIGRRILLTEIDRQILPDGGHAERSTHYQRYTLDFYLLALLTARRAGDRAAEAAFASAAQRLAAFTRTIADDAGRLPLIGDDDGGMLWPLTGRDCNDVRDSLSLASALFDRPDLAPWGITEEAIWIGGAGLTDLGDTSRSTTRASTPAASATLLAATGYFVSRDGRGSHAVLDVGRHGYMNAGHAHADALSLTLSIHGRPLLVDPGTSSYTVDRVVRDRMRGTASHNTVTLDGRPQSVPRGPFHWETQAHARARAWGHERDGSWIEGTHDGYGDSRHRRTFVSAGEEWLIVDEVLGSGTHSAAAHWHFDPAWRVEEYDAGALRAEHDDTTVIWLLHDGDHASLHYGDDEAGLGWYAPVYGTLIPTWSARITRSAVTPLAIVTWIGVGGTRPSLRRSRIDSGPSLSIEITREDRRSTFQLRPGQDAAPAFHAGSTLGKTLPLARV